jgi:hypothetical protein
MSNDHYVPQSFLRAWSFDSSKKKVYRYGRIKGLKCVFTPASIISIASSQNLYSITDGTEQVSFESGVMARALDDPIAKAVKKFRDQSLGELGDEERDQLGRLILTLEARNPATIGEMNLSEADLSRVITEVTDGASPAARAEVSNLLKKMSKSTGTFAAGAYASWVYFLDLQALKKKRWTEVRIESDERPFVTSNYPTLMGATVPYENDRHISSLAMSPNKALLIASADFFENFKEIDAWTQCRYINLLTIAGASEAYTCQPEPDPWIERHLGWVKRTEPRNREDYFESALYE